MSDQDDARELAEIMGDLHRMAAKFGGVTMADREKELEAEIIRLKSRVDYLEGWKQGAEGSELRIRADERERCAAMLERLGSGLGPASVCAGIIRSMNESARAEPLTNGDE